LYGNEIQLGRKAQPFDLAMSLRIKHPSLVVTSTTDQTLSHHTGLLRLYSPLFCGRSNTSTPTSKSRRIEMAKGLAHRLSGAQVSTLLKFCLSIGSPG